MLLMVDKNSSLPSKTSVARSFSRAAKHYDSEAQLQKRVASHLRERLQNLRQVPDTILDIGSGTGRCTRHINHKYPNANIFALDIAHGMLSKAREGDHQIPSAHYICADMESLPIKRNYIDLIYSNLVFQWCTNLEQLFKELKRIINHKGKILFTFLSEHTLSELRQSWAAIDNNIHVNQFIGIEDTKQTIEKTGLKVDFMKKIPVVMYYRDVYSLMYSLKNIGASNMNSNRCRTLTPKKHLLGMIENYEMYRTTEGLPASYEVIIAQLATNTH